MEFSDIGHLCFDVGNAFREMGDKAQNVPVVAGVIQVPAYAIANFFWEMGLVFFKADSWADVISGALGAILSWDQIKEFIENTWTWMKDFPGNVRELALEVINLAYPWLKDIAGKIWETVSANFAELRSWVVEHFEYIWNWAERRFEDIRGELDQLGEKVGHFLYEWLILNFWQWLKDRAADVVSVGGEILEAVW